MSNAPTKEVSKDSANVVDLPSGSGPAKNPAGQRRLSESTYDLLVEALRATEDPVLAAARVGVDKRTARKCWFVGLGPAYRFGQRPVCELVREEKLAARAMLGAEAEAPSAEEVEAARKDHARSRADEARMLRVAKGNVLGVLAVTSQMVAGAVDLSKLVSKELKNFHDPMRAMRLMRDMSTMMRSGVEAVQLVMELERKALGGGNFGGGRDVMSVEEAERELREVESALTRAKSRWGDAGLEARDAADASLEGEPKKRPRIAEALDEVKRINQERLRGAPGSASDVSASGEPPGDDDDELEDLS
jgi:hypothetical protein